MNKWFSIIDVEHDKMCKIIKLASILNYTDLNDCSKCSELFMYLIVILSAYNINNDPCPNKILYYRCFEYVNAELIKECLLNPQIIHFLARNVKALKENNDYCRSKEPVVREAVKKEFIKNKRKAVEEELLQEINAKLLLEINSSDTLLSVTANAANTLSDVMSLKKYRGLFHFEILNVALGNVNILELKRINPKDKDEYEEWNTTISETIGTYYEPEIRDVTKRLLIFALNKVYDGPTIDHPKHTQPTTTMVADASASAHAFSCLTQGGKSRRKTKYRKTRKNKLSKKTHRRSRK